MLLKRLNEERNAYEKKNILIETLSEEKQNIFNELEEVSYFNSMY